MESDTIEGNGEKSEFAMVEKAYRRRHKGAEE